VFEVPVPIIASLRLPLLPLVGACVLAAALPATASAQSARGAAVGSPFVGLVSEEAFFSADRDAIMRRQQQELGVGMLRQTFYWSYIERRPGVFDFAREDAFMAAAARNGINVLPILFDPPDHHSARPSGDLRRGTYPPRSMASMERFAAEVARRYGPSGTFWAQNPGLPRRAIRSYQIWNEPNLPAYWLPRPNARSYVSMLRAVRRGIRGVDPRAEIVTAGMPQSRIRGAIGLERYLKQMYAAGARTTFDTLAVNPYAPKGRDVLVRVRGVRKVMNARQHAKAGIWVTELGWSDRGPKGQFRAGQKGQGREIRAAVRELWRTRRALRLRGFVYFNWQDAPPYPGGKDFWGLYTGLVQRDGRAKPAFAEFGRTVRGLR
jgi:hypothetical protein